MDTVKVKPVGVPFVLVYILVPIVVMALGAYLPIFIFGPTAGATGGLAMLSGLFFILWLILFPFLSFKNRRKAAEKMMDNNGFVRNQTFNGQSCIVWIDLVHRQVALLFRWNPFHFYRFPGSAVQKAWVDDGRSGGLEITSRVRFAFMVGGTRVRVDTFTSNRLCSMSDPRIVEGLAKAQRMVDLLDLAREGA